MYDMHIICICIIGWKCALSVSGCNYELWAAGRGNIHYALLVQCSLWYLLKCFIPYKVIIELVQTLTFIIMYIIHIALSGRSKMEICINW